MSMISTVCYDAAQEIILNLGIEYWIVLQLSTRNHQTFFTKMLTKTIMMEHQRVD